MRPSEDALAQHDVLSERRDAERAVSKTSPLQQRFMDRYTIGRFVGACGVAFAAIALVPAAGAQTLTFSVTQVSISFADADPDTTASITAANVVVNYRVTGNAGGNWRITVISGTDLTSGGASIPISNVTWTATPAPPFQPGTMSTTVQQTMAAGTGNVNSTRTGTVVFRLANSWSYNVGAYTATFTFTLTAP
jgi:hypothetical protein